MSVSCVTNGGKSTLSFFPNQIFQSNKWLVESSRPATSDKFDVRKSSYPSPPDITKNFVVFTWGMSGSILLLELFFDGVPFFGRGYGISTEVNIRTWPVCPWGTPVTGGIVPNFPVVGVTWGNGIVSRTPADVPIHKRSLQCTKAVTRRQAALCCRIMSSQPTT